MGRQHVSVLWFLWIVCDCFCLKNEYLHIPVTPQCKRRGRAGFSPLTGRMKFSLFFFCKFSLHLLIYFLFSAFICVVVRGRLAVWFSPSVVCFLGLELRSSSLVASAFIYQPLHGFQEWWWILYYWWSVPLKHLLQESSYFVALGI